MVHIVSKIYYLVGLFWLFPLLGPINVLQIRIPWIPNCNIFYLFFIKKKLDFWGLFHNISRIRHYVLTESYCKFRYFSLFRPFLGPLMYPITTYTPLYCIIVNLLYYYNIEKAF